MSSDTVQEWGVEDVCKWLGGLNLETLEPAFKSNAVDGKDLLELSEGDMKDYLGCTPLQVRGMRGQQLPRLALGRRPSRRQYCQCRPQIRKINKGLAELGALTKAGAAAAAAAPAASAPAEPAAPAPSKPVVASKGTPTIDASDLSRYKELTQKIDALEAEQVLPADSSAAESWARCIGPSAPSMLPKRRPGCGYLASLAFPNVVAGEGQAERGHARLSGCAGGAAARTKGAAPTAGRRGGGGQGGKPVV